jgi:hypothetical protein
MKAAKLVAGLSLGMILAASAVLPGVAHADSIGAVGQIVGIEINEDSSDEYGIYRGRIFLKETPTTVQVYRWGGVACNGYVLMESQIALLSATMSSKTARLIPYWKIGAGGARCLVSFGATNSIKNAPAITR